MDWQARLAERGVLVADGAWGTELARRGLPPGRAPELWNVDQPDAVREVAQGYVDAGADIILTNTFGGSRFRLDHSGAADRVDELNRRGVALSVEAAAGRALVFASVGPTGEFMAPLGLKAEAEFIACFAEQIAALAAGGADGLVIETMQDLGEAQAALQAARQVCDLPVVVSMTYDKGPAGYATMMGVRPEQAAQGLAAADVLGANCGTGIDDLIGVARALHAVTDKPLWIKPNAGQPELVDGQTVYRETPERMAHRLPELIDAGARIVGGCCGTTPEHVRCFCTTVEPLRERVRQAG